MTEFKKNGSGFFFWNTSLPVAVGTIAGDAHTVDYEDNDPNSIKYNEILHLSNILNIETSRILMLSQVHGDSILVINEVYKEKDAFFPEADGMITDIKELCLVIRTADCVPVFAYDIDKKVMGAVHSGWRGCRQNISGKLIREMKRVYNSDPENIVVFILPSIGPEHYSINQDVAIFFQKDTETRNNKVYLNLWQNIERSLLPEGILKRNIHNSGISTYNDNDFFSYRKGNSGRNLNFGYLKKQRSN